MLSSQMFCTGLSPWLSQQNLDTAKVPFLTDSPAHGTRPPRTGIHKALEKVCPLFDRQQLPDRDFLPDIDPNIELLLLRVRATQGDLWDAVLYWQGSPGVAPGAFFDGAAYADRFDTESLLIENENAGPHTSISAQRP
jgi:hypothetical protein